MPASVLMIVNPVSGGGQGPGIAGTLQRTLEARGFRVHVRRTACAGDGTRIAATESAGHTCVLAVGGDGTINEVVCGLVGRAVPMGIVPLGTANVMAKEFGHTRQPEAVAALVAGGRVRRIDLIEVSEPDGTLRRYAAAMTGAGFDAQIVSRFHHVKRGPIQGPLLYAGWGFSMLFDYRVPSMSVEIDGRLVDDDASFVVVCNTRRYAGPLSFTPSAHPDDGLLDVYRYHALGRFDYLRAFFFALLHRPQWSGRSACSQGRDVTIRVRRGPVAMQIDGDPAGCAPARARILPAALALLVPPVR